MKNLGHWMFLVIILCSGCAVRVVPDQITSGVINQKERSITLANDRIIMSVSPADPDMINYNIESMVASFLVEIQNGSATEAVFDSESFILLDADRRQYYQLTPEKIRQMLAKDSYYLMPYPYVGFYYLEDYEKAEFRNSTGTNLPYYFEVNPQELYTRALPVAPLIPGANTKGLIYFNVDINSLNSFSILAFRKGTKKTGNPDFIFPFRVEK